MGSGFQSFVRLNQVDVVRETAAGNDDERAFFNVLPSRGHLPLTHYFEPPDQPLGEYRGGDREIAPADVAEHEVRPGYVAVAADVP